MSETRKKKKSAARAADPAPATPEPAPKRDATLAPLPPDFGVGEEHELLRESARRFLAERSSIDQVRKVAASPEGFDRALWKEIGELGWLGLVLPETLGGAGLGWLHQALLFEEMGRAMLPSPYLGHLLATEALRTAGSEAQQARWLPALASGERIATLAFVEPNTGWEPDRVAASAEPAKESKSRGAGHVLWGDKAHVVGAQFADLVVAPFHLPDGTVVLFAVEADARGLRTTPEVGVDPTRRTARVRFDSVHVEPDAMLTGDGRDALERVYLRGYAMLAAEMVGAAEAALELTRTYAIDRKQFGKPIGAFQAVKHPIVDMMIEIEMARSHAYAAAAALDHAPEQAELRARMAKASASDAFAGAVRKAIQLHGGFGFTIDCDAHWYFKRALWTRAMLGDAVHHRRVLAEALFGSA